MERFFREILFMPLNNTTRVPDEWLASRLLGGWVTSSSCVPRDEKRPTPTPGGELGLPTRIFSRGQMSIFLRRSTTRVHPLRILLGSDHERENRDLTPLEGNPN